MSCSSREEIAWATDGLRDAVNRWCDLAFDAITGKERLALLETVEIVTRRLHAPGHTLINQLAEQSTTKELGGRLHIVLGGRLHLTRPDALRRIRDAEDLGQRTALTGETLPPKLPATATAHRDGLIGDTHITEIRNFFTHLPTTVAPDAREEADTQLAQLAIDLRPDELHQDAAKLLDLMDPDGAARSEEADRVRARKRGITLGTQDKDLMSRISGHIDPELRAVLEAINATLGTPGRCNRDNEHPVTDDEPSEEAARRDTRSTSQRFHDALLAAGRALLMSGTLGQHNGLPTSIVVTTTLKELEAAAGRGLTGGGTLLPMSDVIRLSRHAHHYLAIFDNHSKTLALYHTKRLANPAQRLVLYARDRGCTFPGCPVPGYQCEVHHVIPYAQSGQTDINGLAFGCGAHHPLAEKDWHTRRTATGDTEWIPPAHLDHGQRRTNRYHHPQKLLHETSQCEEEPA